MCFTLSVYVRLYASLRLWSTVRRFQTFRTSTEKRFYISQRCFAWAWSLQCMLNMDVRDLYPFAGPLQCHSNPCSCVENRTAMTNPRNLCISSFCFEVWTRSHMGIGVWGGRRVLWCSLQGQSTLCLAHEGDSLTGASVEASALE